MLLSQNTARLAKQVGFVCYTDTKYYYTDSSDKPMMSATQGTNEELVGGYQATNVYELKDWLRERKMLDVFVQPSEKKLKDGTPVLEWCGSYRPINKTVNGYFLDSAKDRVYGQKYLEVLDKALFNALVHLSKLERGDLLNGSR